MVRREISRRDNSRSWSVTTPRIKSPAAARPSFRCNSSSMVRRSWQHHRCHLDAPGHRPWKCPYLRRRERSRQQRYRIRRPHLHGRLCPDSALSPAPTSHPPSQPCRAPELSTQQRVSVPAPGSRFSGAISPAGGARMGRAAISTVPRSHFPEWRHRTVDSVPAYIRYMSSTQANVQAPDDPNTGAGIQVVRDEIQRAKAMSDDAKKSNRPRPPRALFVQRARRTNTSSPSSRPDLRRQARADRRPCLSACPSWRNHHCLRHRIWPRGSRHAGGAITLAKQFPKYFTSASDRRLPLSPMPVWRRVSSAFTSSISSFPMSPAAICR